METHKQFYRFLLSLQRISENANLERIPKESRRHPERTRQNQDWKQGKLWQE